MCTHRRRGKTKTWENPGLVKPSPMLEVTIWPTSWHQVLIYRSHISTGGERCAINQFGFDAHIEVVADPSVYGVVILEALVTIRVPRRQKGYIKWFDD